MSAIKRSRPGGGHAREPERRGGMEGAGPKKTGGKSEADDFAGLATEAVHAAGESLGTLSAEAVVRLLLDEEIAAARAVRRQAAAIARAATLFAEAIGGGGRVVYVGAGSSGRMGALDAAELPPTFGTRPDQVVAIVAGGVAALRRAVEGAEDRTEPAVRAIARLSVGEKDLVCGIAASGVTPFPSAALVEARRRGARTVLITCAPPSRELLDAADVVVAVVVGAEVVAGSTRLKAGTATKLVLTAISTTAMVRLGKVFRGRMVDLRATNRKLRARALRIVGELGEVAAGEAQALLDEAGGEVRPALAAALLGVSVKEARNALTAVNGQLDALVDERRTRG